MSKMIILFVVLLASCTNKPVSPEDFWYGQGYRFGSNGYDFDNSQLPSLKEKVKFDEDSYQKGYLDGKKVYCDPDQAFNKGISGEKYTGQCDDSPQDVRIRVEWQRGWDAFIGADMIRVR
ncbi:DUF2799 domain-containing protein [Vibrio sp. CK2-1]|uniref:DUF2799 domain-containing protein n=1 Tax=Vibrio sp. CK2-1 TaxID=2912249 RepID=UPI001F41AA3F|nr:DUF2799 domain-containing protein [Vibrio sp. CK2-1]MCF7354368.1 DUF2799 domain-containing protein [Vibrio sp. CK2-1]